jgi:hypothetical protein
MCPAMNLVALELATSARRLGETLANRNKPGHLQASA